MLLDHETLEKLLMLDEDTRPEDKMMKVGLDELQQKHTRLLTAELQKLAARSRL